MPPANRGERKQQKHNRDSSGDRGSERCKRSQNPHPFDFAQGRLCLRKPAETRVGHPGSSTRMVVVTAVSKQYRGTGLSDAQSDL